MSKSKNKKKQKHRRLNKKRIFMFLVFLIFVFLIIYSVYNIKITNIYIEGNLYLKDQEIIDLAKINDYPKSISIFSVEIEKNIKESDYIFDVDVKKNLFLNKVYIKVKENYPLFYSIPNNKTILYDGTTVDVNCNCTTLINIIPNTIYDKFLLKMQSVNKDILNRISEIEYKPNSVDDERFFFIMNDGNYVYITINKLLNINKYVDMIKTFNNQNGVLHLDSGEYFSIFNE